jgi:hypothetical protein
MATDEGQQETTPSQRHRSSFLLAVVIFVALFAAGGCGARSRPQPTPPPPATPTATPSPSPAPTATVIHTATAAPTAAGAKGAATPTPLPAIRAKIEVVWPHDGASVREASLANITVYLLAPDANEAPPCDWEPVVRLWAARNTEPAHPIAIGQKRMLATDGRTFPVWDFNDVDVSAARDPANKLTFFATVDGTRTYHNVWVHAQDARTIMPQPDRPTGLVDERPAAVDARIEIVWPHDGLPPEEATLANITTYIFEAESLNALSTELDWRPEVRLHRALNADAESPEGQPVEGQPRAVAADGGKSFLAWDFNDVDVSAAQDRLNKLYFWVSVDGAASYPNVWAHGADTPTYFPQVDLPASCG